MLTTRSPRDSSLLGQSVQSGRSACQSPGRTHLDSGGGGLYSVPCESPYGLVPSLSTTLSYMSIPETTSAEAFWRYAEGRCLFESRGEAWRDVKAWLTALPPIVDTLHLPAVGEPFLD